MPERNGAVADGTAGADRTDVQRVLARIWAYALQRTDDIADEENFFEAGGDSLAMMMILFRVNEELGVDLLPAALTEAPSFKAFCGLVEARRNPSGVVELEIR